MHMQSRAILPSSWGVLARKNPQPLRDQAYNAIKSGIILQRWAVGDPLSEDQLTQELGMSRTPVREALQALAREGFVQVLPARGTFVAGLSADDLREIFEFREALESQTARLAAERSTSRDIAELSETVALVREPHPCSSAGPVFDFREMLQRVEEYHRTGREFHGCVARVAGNYRLQEALSNLLCLTIPTRVGYGLSRRESIQAEHVEIVEAIRQHDAEAAESLMRHHIRSTYESLPAPRGG